MFKKYDFVFIYEVKNRELESICLLRYELERRGYTVKFIETWEQQLWKSFPVRAEVAVVFALYDKATLDFMNSFVFGCRKYVNLQWEQVYTNGDAKRIKNREKNSFVMDDVAREGVHISWGQNNYERLVKIYQISSNNVIKAGCVSLDFLHKRFRKYYFSKGELYGRYSIDINKKVCLFISSFSYVGLPKNIADSDLYQNQGFNFNNFCDVSIKSQGIILDWISRVLERFPDLIFVYRPHPAEKDNSVLLKMEREHKNFRVIREESVKQWILVVDKIYTWWSTSIGEIFAANKGCSVLRPIKIPDDAELECYEGARVIETYENFEHSFSGENTLPVLREVLDNCWHIDSEECAYMKVVNLLEKVWGSEEFVISGLKIDVFPQKYARTILDNLKGVLVRYIISCEWLYNIGGKISSKQVFNNNIRNQIKESIEYSKNLVQNNHMDEREIKDIMEKIKRCIECIESV